MATSRKKSLEKLAITPAHIDAQPTITPQLRKLDTLLLKHVPPDIALQGYYYYLHCSDAPEARLVLDAYYKLPKSSRDSLPIEAYCVAAKVSTLKVLEIIYGTAARISQHHVVVATAMAAEAQPQIVEASIENAKLRGLEGFGDRQMLAKVSGLLPQPRGTSIKITQNASAMAAANASAAPPPEATIRRLVDRFNERRSQTAVIDVPLEPEDADE